MKKLIVLAILFLNGCQASNYSQALETWVGQTQEHLIQAWGAPQNIIYISPTKQLWTYVKVSSRANDKNPYANEIYYPAISTPDFGLPSQSQQALYYCKTMFTLSGNIITDYSFNGDDCVVDR